MNPQFPIYIPSKGRSDTRLTIKALEAMHVPFTVVVEQAEYEQYRAVVSAANSVLVLDPAYQRSYDTFDTLDESKPKGSGPARNFIWDHALAAGAAWHWVIDDNIRSFMRWNRNRHEYMGDGTAFRCMEDFVLRYRNVALAGPAYKMFAPKINKVSAFVPNTRIYSCCLVRNDIKFRWRGRFNEDTDLSLRVLKAGWCTIEFYAFLADKTVTLSMRGGNTDTIYVGGTLAKSRMIVAMHPDVATLKFKYGRWHHHVTYGPFKRNKLLLREGVEIRQGVDEYGLQIVNEPWAGSQLAKRKNRRPVARPAALK